jgi:hypothetical protein
VIIKEGIGNQLFQFAYGLWKVELNTSKLLLDVSSYDRSNRHGGFALHYIMGDFLLNKTQKIDWRNFDFGSSAYLNLKRQPSLFYDGPNMSNDFNQIVADGWFQNYAYVHPVLKQMRDWFELSTMDKNQSNDFFEENYVIGVHLRRGDYLNPNFRSLFGIVDTQSLINQVNKIHSEHASNKPIKFALFTDGIVSGKFDRIEIRSENSTPYDDVQTLYRMSRCEHLICSNSTFSLWAGYLSSKLKTISLPDNWTQSKKILTKDLLPPNGRTYAVNLS